MYFLYPFWIFKETFLKEMPLTKYHELRLFLVFYLANRKKSVLIMEWKQKYMIRFPLLYFSICFLADPYLQSLDLDSL